MTPLQFYIAVAATPVSTIIAVVIGVLLNNNILNHRLGEMDQRINDLNRRIDDLNAHMNERLNDLRDLLRAEMAKNHSEAMAKFAELDQRISRIEARQ